MKLSEIKGEQALDVMADLVEPIAEIFSDKEVQQIYKAKQPYIKMVKPAIKNHKSAVITILALLDGEDPGKYTKKINLLSLPGKLLEILNDKDLQEVFRSQGQMMDEDVSGSATEDTEGAEN